MTASISPRGATVLRERLAGRVMLPPDEGYEAARQVWNASHDYRPALIVRPLSTADVRTAIGLAADQGLPVSIRGGGCSHAGYAVADGALMLDLSAMSSVQFDPARRTLTVGGGSTWGMVDGAAQAAGLAVTGADVSAVGVGGSTLGGGVGWLQRVQGLSCDNLLAAEIVTADAEVLVVYPGRHPELFWALRGGGGNFGAVTALTFALHPVAIVATAMVMCPAERAAEALGLYQHLSSRGDELSVPAMLLTAPPMPFIPEQLQGRPVVMLSAAWFGPPGDAASALRELRQFTPPARTWCAFRHRDAAHYLGINTMAPPTDPDDEQAAWAEKVNASIPAGTILGPDLHALGRDEPEHRVREACGAAAYARLAAVKHAYDPDNMFRFNQNIRPRDHSGVAGGAHHGTFGH